MSMKKAIAAALVVGTMTMTGAAFAGPRFHDRHGSSQALRWEMRKHQVEHRHNVIRHKQAVRRHIAHKVMRNRARRTR